MVMVVMIVAAAVGVIMRMAISEQPGAGEVDQKADAGNHDRLVIVDRTWRDQALDRVEEHEAGNDDEQDRGVPEDGGEVEPHGLPVEQHADRAGDREVPVIVTYHPAYLLRNLPDKAKAWEDLCRARALMRTLKTQ